MELSLDTKTLGLFQDAETSNRSEYQTTNSLKSKNQTSDHQSSCESIPSISVFDKKRISYIEPPIFFRDGKQWRESYYNKLKQQKIGTEKKYNSIIIFDWDDTLCCSSFLIKTNIITFTVGTNRDPINPSNSALSDTQIQKWAKLEFHILNILTISLKFGDTYIITNASEGWVEYSAMKFFPSITTWFNRIKIISARSKFEAWYPNNGQQWKVEAFNEVALSYNKYIITNIICWGDSNAEMEAAQNWSQHFHESYIKTIKFREEPKPEQIIKQWNLVSKQFNMIQSKVKNLAIRVERKDRKKKALEHVTNEFDHSRNDNESESVASSLMSEW